MREVELLRLAQHENIVGIHHAFQRGSRVDIMLELCEADLRPSFGLGFGWVGEYCIEKLVTSIYKESSNQEQLQVRLGVVSAIK